MVIIGVLILVFYVIVGLFLVYAERKVCAFMQNRLGPNRVGPFGIFQTIADLIKKDKLFTERKSLKDLILEMEDEVLANAGVDVFEELFKLIFTKLYDEMESGRNHA
ncbi:MAG: NADH-quinone oxidoreductase subunit H, partial [Candidatus Saganbacteria bacterium]|nr:NADH-quinone oxidoreductase subunit H [Candidatus Saganbacteria bacterium]